jgi:hypothetical protein
MKIAARVAMFIAAFLCADLALAFARPAAPTPSAAHLVYLSDGRVELPKTYRDWPYLSSGIDMNYSASPMMMDHHEFDNVFVDPEALRAFRTSGTWPDGTVFAREDREGQTKGSINKSGQYQGEAVMSLELHVKDSVRFKNGGWAFFVFGSNAPAQAIPSGASCYECHSAHGAVDTTFVQFYPTLIATAKQKKTFHVR